MSTPYWCPNCDGELEFVGSIGLMLHPQGDVQADRYDCNSGHTVLVIDTPEATLPTRPRWSDQAVAR